jgi:two-component sensor histidine kinase
MAGSPIDNALETDGVIRQLMDAVRDAMVLVDQAGDIVMINARAERMFGYQRQELVGQPVKALIPAPLHREGEGLEFFGLRKDGEQFPAEIDFRPLEIKGVRLTSSVIRDLSEQKPAEDLRRRLQEKDALLGEIHHRVKNNLQVVSSLLNLQANQLQDPAARGMFEATQSRIRSMALVHEQLYKSGNFSGIDFATYLRVLAADLLNSYRSNAEWVHVRVTADPTRLDLEIAIPCGMIVNELITNSLKHAFPDRAEGEIRIGFRAGGDQYSLSVDDDGVALPPGLLARESDSMGLRLVKLLARQLGSELQAGPEGQPKFTLTFPRRPGPR